VKVTVVWATREVQDAVTVVLPPGATVADAVARSGLVPQHRIDPTALAFAVYGRRRKADAPVADGDRVELTRPLPADPGTARVRRARDNPLPKTPRRVKPGRAN
jgi:putative ubiquitin-RnfH superfamily antitoxin RatB of RatAB toxin-antitoxin module